MVYRRNKQGKRKYRKLVRRSTLKTRLYRQMNNQGMFHVKQHVNGSTIIGLLSRTISQTVAVQNLGLEFRFRDIPQFGTFSNIWDMYRINKIAISFVPMSNVNVVNSNVVNINPGIIASVIDYDNGAGALAALDQYEQYSNCKITPVVRGKSHTRVFRPRINIGVQNQGGAVLGGRNSKSGWIDCSLPDIAHHGLKVYIDAYGAIGSAQTWQVFARYYVSFKNVH